MIVMSSDVFPEPFGPKRMCVSPAVDLQVDVPKHLPFAQLHLKILYKKHFSLLCIILNRQLP